MMNKFIFFLVVFLNIFVLGCRQNSKMNLDGSASAMVVSISSDGRFAISSHRDNRLLLWDLKTQKKDLISTTANIYSAYFIRHSDKFIWQDLNNTVFVQNIGGKIIESFSHLATYGQVMSSDLSNYFSSDIGSGIDHIGIDRKKNTIKKTDGKSFLGFGKLLNLTLDDKNYYLLSSAFSYDFIEKTPLENEKEKNNNFMDLSGAILWDVATGEPTAKLMGHSAKTTATLSPDGHRVVTGDEGGGIFVWETKSGNKRLEPADLFHGTLNKNNSDDYEKWSFDKSDLIATPMDFKPNFAAILALKFIDHKHYLRFTTNEPYAVLCDVDNQLPLKYLPLGRDPFPAVSDYSRNAAIDTAPDSGVLVMGQRDGSGIIVYQYHAEKQELEKVWVGE